VRRRLLGSTLVVALVSLILLGIPLGIVATKLLRGEAQTRMNREVTQIASAIDASRNTAGPLTDGVLRQLVPSDRYVVVRDERGTVFSVGQRVSGHAEIAVGVDAHDDRVSVYASQDATNNDVATVWIGIAAFAIIALAAAVELARRQARRLGRPLEDLAVGAEALGAGDTRPRQHRYGVPELDKVAEVLDRSAERIGRLLAAERELAADASHQLRTPLTALSIRLEEIVGRTTEPAVREEAVAALVQVERLGAVVASLLVEHRRTSRGSSAVLVDVDEVLKQQCVEWAPAFRRVGRAISYHGTGGLQVSTIPGGLAQVVATLIDNALQHGAGAVNLITRHAGDHVVIEVHDEGPGIADELQPHIFERSFSGARSTGLGLALARDLVAADGGRLELAQARPPIFAIFFPPGHPPE
jgi:signal transduction histidine kinase